MASFHTPPARLLALVTTILISYTPAEGQTSVGYYGRYIGPLSRLNHGVSGEVYAVDARTLHIRDFTYDGEGPAAYFYAGNTKSVGPGGFFIRDETGSNGVLRRYNKKHITITLPEGKTLNNIRWFSVWCEEFAVNFGDIQIPRGLDYPKPQKIGALSGVHGVSSENIVIVDAQTLLIPSFSYDGEAPDAKFWVGRGPKPSPQGIRVPDENGKQIPLRRYDRKTIVLTLPGDLTIFDIGHFGVWCEAFTVDFGHVQVPPSLNVPPSLRMLGVSPQSKLNCEVLSNDLAYEVRWAVAGDSIVIQLVAKLEEGEYMSFGLSGEEDRSAMVGGDVVVAWVDQETLNGFAQDYYLDAKSQCSGTHGSCPDANIENNADSVRLLNAALVNGYSIVTYQRPLRAHDGLDKAIVTNKSQAVIWAVGPLNQKREVSYHSITSKGDIFIDFGRPPKWNCPIPQTDTSAEGTSTNEDHREIPPTVQQKQMTESPSNHRTPPPPAPAPIPRGAWEIPPIQCNEPDDGVFYAQMGPTGGKKGYSAITGHVGWGIAYYINGLLIPEIHVVRGKTYNFVVEGGNNPDIPAKFHPFYITDDPVGGYQHKTAEERRKVNIYAGAELNKNGEVVPTGIGRLCNWTPDPNEPMGDEFASFGAYQRTLTLVCDHGEPAVVQWTPDRDTPDTVYYQCFTHRYLGWKVHVHDRCDLPSVSGSDPVPSVVLPEEELQAKPSIQVSTRVKPDFPPQSLTSGGKDKHPVKQQFPYEFMKPAVEVKKFNGTGGQVKPVKEVFEDTPETTTAKQFIRSNSTYNVGENNVLPKPGVPVQHVSNIPMRIPYGNLRPPPTRRPQPVMVVRRPVQQVQPQMIMKPPQHIPHFNNQHIPHFNNQHIPHFNNQHIPHMNNQHIPLIKNQPISHINNQQIPHMNMPMIHHSGTQSRPVIVKKPIMKLPPRQPVMPMRTAPPLPPQVMASHAVGNRPSAPSKPVYIHKFKKTPPSATSLVDKTKIKMHPSQMISSNPEEPTTKLPIAVNTGFNPGSLVIESGFKPIINTQQVAEERVSEVEYDDEDNSEGVINMESTSAEEQKSQTEMFEPMFIPSPLDSNTKPNKKATTEPVKKIRKPIRQVIMRRPVYEEPLFRSEPDDEEDEEAMANEKMETIYDGKHSVLTYDGKKVSGEIAPPVPPSSKTGTKNSELLKHSPQFGPFKGEIPPPVPKKVLGDFPQLKQQSRPIALPLKSENNTEAEATTVKEEVEVVTAQVAEETSTSTGETTKEEKRQRRSAHHEPGHNEPAPEPEPTKDQDHDHDSHDHSHHDHSTHQNAQSNNQKPNSAFKVNPIFMLTITCAYLTIF